MGSVHRRTIHLLPSLSGQQNVLRGDRYIGISECVNTSSRVVISSHPQSIFRCKWMKHLSMSAKGMPVGEPNKVLLMLHWLVSLNATWIRNSEHHVNWFGLQ